MMEKAGMKSPYKIKYKPGKRKSEGTRIVMLLMIASVVVTGFVYTFMHTEAKMVPPEETKSLYPTIKAEDLGKTARQLKQKYPALFLTTDRYGLLTGQHKLDGADHTIWFVAENKEYIAFRVKAKKTLKAAREREFLTHFGKLYGRAFDGQCQGKSTYALENCHYKWWVRKAVTLDLYSRFTDKTSLTLSAITTDTYLSSKHHHQVQAVLPTQ